MELSLLAQVLSNIQVVSIRGIQDFEKDGGGKGYGFGKEDFLCESVSISLQQYNHLNSDGV